MKSSTESVFNKIQVNRNSYIQNNQPTLATPVTRPNLNNLKISNPICQITALIIKPKQLMSLKGFSL